MNKAFLLPIVLLSMQSCAPQRELNLLVGTYTKPGGSEGIYVYRFNTETAEFELKKVNKGIQDPSYLTLSPNQKFVYSVNESGDNSTVSAFAYDALSAELKLLNKQPAGADPCFIIADQYHVISANYSGGNASVFGIQDDGSLSPLKQLVQHNGKSVDEERQNGPHVHMVQFSPDHKYVVMNDLGTDKVHLYAYQKDQAKAVLVPHDSVAVEPGSGPRILTFSKDGQYAYLIDEMFAGITVFEYHEGTLKKIQSTRMAADGANAENGAAHIQISPDGKYLYASNRGSENTIGIFAIGADGLLTKKEVMSSGGKGPRNFVIDPSGKYLLVAQQNSNNIVIFARDQNTGALKDTGKRIEIAAPVCLVFSESK